MGSLGRIQALCSLISLIHKEDTSICCDAPAAPLDSLSRQALRDREAPASLSRTDNGEEKIRDVWLLFPWVMSYPDFVYRALLPVRVCFVCMENL